MRTWDSKELRRRIEELVKLRADMVELEASSGKLLDQLAAPFSASGRNLLHYVALRRHDLRQLQDRLAALGLSSLGRAEGCVLSSIDAVMGILEHLDGPKNAHASPETVPSFAEGKRLLNAHTEALLGGTPPGRSVRIMVTMAKEAAEDYAVVRDLVQAGMNCMRVNCAHDDERVWERMIGHLRRAEQELGRRCRVLMDLVQN